MTSNSLYSPEVPPSPPSLRLQAQAEMELRRRQQQAAKEQIPAPNPEFRGGALQVRQTTATEFILSGPAETGKTFVTLWHLHTLCRDNANLQAVIIRKTLSDIAPSVLQTFTKKILPFDSSVEVRPFGGNHPEWFDYPNGSRVWLGGMDKPGKTLSSERDIIYVNQAEQLTLEDWETLTTRATGRAGNLKNAAGETIALMFGDCNPGPPNHWIRQRAAQKALELYESRHEDNPRLYTAAGELTPEGVKTMEKLDKLTGVRKKRYRFGLWVQAEGAVYENYDPALHLIDEMPAGWEAWRKFRVIDFGLTNPFVCQWWAVDGDGRMFRYRVLYRTGRTVKTHAAVILQQTLHVDSETWERWGERGDEPRIEIVNAITRGDAIVLAALLDCSEAEARDYIDRAEVIDETICDHDAEDRATLDENGIPNSAAQKAVRIGIDKVTDRLEKQLDGRPRIFFLKDALVELDQDLLDQKKPTDDVSEFESYVWKNGAKKEEPVKEDDHGMDATRYGVMYLDGSTGGFLFGV